jgi:hypothetical protein
MAEDNKRTPNVRKLFSARAIIPQRAVETVLGSRLKGCPRAESEDGEAFFHLFASALRADGHCAVTPGWHKLLELFLTTEAMELVDRHSYPPTRLLLRSNS